MKTTDNFVSVTAMCAVCKYAYPTYNAYYCNADNSCPYKTRSEFDTAAKSGTKGPNSPLVVWLALKDENDWRSSERYVGKGYGLCDKFEREENE